MQGVRAVASGAGFADIRAGARKLGRAPANACAFPAFGAARSRSIASATRPALCLAIGVLRGAARAHDRSSGEQRRELEANQSLDFGGGPIWIRSPMYEPISVNTTPRKDMSAYMNAGIVFTVWPA